MIRVSSYRSLFGPSVTVIKENSYSSIMLLYKCYLNTVTRTVSKHTATVLLYYNINITLTQSHLPSVNRSSSSVMLSYKYYLNTVKRTVSKHTATVLLYYHINITLTQSHVPSVN